MSVAAVEAPARPLATEQPRTRRLVQLALLLAPVVFLVAMGFARRWVEEDAFLNFRVVDQVRAGHGPVFNVGERVEVYTSTLWLALLVVGRTVLPFVKLEYLSIAGGLLFTGLGLWWAQRGSIVLWERAGRSRALFVPLGAVVVAALPASWDWATSGLENGLSIGWLGAVMFVFAQYAQRDAAPSSAALTIGVGVLFGLGPLVRPDLAIVSVVVLAAAWWVRRPRGADLARLLGGFVALPVVYEIFRAGYFGTLVPNPALAKDSSGMYWSQGWQYLVDLVAPYVLLVPLAAVVAVLAMTVRAGKQRADLVVLLALPVAGVAHALFIVGSGGDYLHARLMLPSLFAVVAPFAVVPWERRVAVPVAVVGVWALVAMAFLRPTIVDGLVPATKYESVDGRALMEGLTRPGHRPVLASDFAFEDGPRAKRLQEQGARALVTTTKGVLRDVTPERTTLLSSASGVSGYRAGPEVLVQEVNSLADPVGSRMPPTAISRPGHRKHEPWAWVVALVTRPDAEEALDIDNLETGIYGAPEIDPTDVAAARRALRCGALAELRRATRDPLDAGRFWSNLTGSIGRTRLVVPRDPKVAERTFCARAPTK